MTLLILCMVFLLSANIGLSNTVGAAYNLQSLSVSFLSFNSGLAVVVYAILTIFKYPTNRKLSLSHFITILAGLILHLFTQYELVLFSVLISVDSYS